MASDKTVFALLISNGVVLAAHTILARQAHAMGVAPILYALASAAGATLFLLLYRAAKRQRAGLRRSEVAFGAIAGLISIAVPQVLIYSASAYVSAGIASLAYAFPTPLTYVLAAAFALERMTLGRTIGVAIAFSGAISLAASRSATLSGDGLWILLAMLAPVSIAAGNIYRARYWPAGSTPTDLALAMSAGAALWLTAALTMISPTAAASIQPAGYLILLAASLLAAGGTIIYFELQRRGGIVSFSQIGYVGAVVGLASGSLILGERYAASTWWAAALISVGVLISELLKPRVAKAAQ